MASSRFAEPQLRRGALLREVPSPRGEIPPFLVDCDLRDFMVNEAEAHNRTALDCRRFKRLLVEAFLSARSRSKAIAEFGGLLLDTELGAEAIGLARENGVPFGLPAERAGVYPLWLYPNFEVTVAAAQPSFVKCLVKGRPDDAPGLIEQQCSSLAQLSDTCRRFALPLLVEVIVPRKPTEMVGLFEQQLRGTLTSDWLRMLSIRGVKPAAWKLEAPSTEDTAAQIAAACDKGQAILLVDKFSRAPSFASTFAVARTSPRFTGFAAGRSIYWSAFHAHLRGASSDEVLASIRDAYLDSVETWERAAG